MQLLRLCKDDFMKLRHRWPVVRPGDLIASWFSLELTGEQEPAEGIIYCTWPSDASEIPQEALKEWCGPGDVWSSQIRVVQLPPRTCMMQEGSSNDVTPDRAFMLYNINKPMATFLSGICGEGRRTTDGISLTAGMLVTESTCLQTSEWRQGGVHVCIIGGCLVSIAVCSEIRCDILKFMLFSVYAQTAVRTRSQNPENGDSSIKVNQTCFWSK